jgi:hypothetical protein
MKDIEISNLGGVNRLLQKKLSLQYLGFADNKGEFNIAM